MTLSKPILVGETNPYGGDPYYALYPAPAGCAGERLCCKIFGMRRIAYLEAFERIDLVTGKWSIKAARLKAEELSCRDGGARIVLLGSKVCSAFGVPFDPYRIFGLNNCRVILPHPSGLCRLWHEPGAIAKARQAVLTMAPELTETIGVYN